MKFNQWTLGLAAVGAVSLASAVRADEAKLSQLNTALSNTTISGVVDVGYSQQLGDVNRTTEGGSAWLPPYGVGTDSRFTLNQVIVSLDKPLDESAWASGYHIDLNWGTAAINDTIRQAYVALRTPVGNGIDWKVGVFDGVTGYEGNTLSANPNYTRSYAYSLNPATFTGIIGNYKFTDLISAQIGFVNRDASYPVYNGDPASADKRQNHSYIATVSFTAPESFGFLKGSTLNLQTVQGFDNQCIDVYSANATLATPVAGLKLGFAFDALQSIVDGGGDGQIYGIYATYQATDKLSLSLRGEYVHGQDLYSYSYYPTQTEWPWKSGEEITATLSYNLWANVLSRLEFRWDHSENYDAFNADASYRNAFLLAANIAYKF